MQQLLFFLSDNPAMRVMQISLVVLGVIAVFLVCLATRDIILRTNSFLYQVFCVLLVACLPILGYFLYLLVRPARTVKERELLEMVRELLRRGEGECEELVPEEAPEQPVASEATEETTPAS